MSDAWARPDDGDERARPPAEDVIEIELDGPGPLATRSTATSGNAGGAVQPPDWRRVAGISAVAGVALGLAISTAVMLGGDDGDDGSATPTSVDPQLAASQITAPPTLPPVTETVPPEPEASAPQGPTGEVLDPRPAAGEPDRGPSLPTYETVAVDVSPGEFVLDGDVFATARSVTTTVAVAYRGGERVEAAFVSFDAATNRARIRFGGADEPVELVLDADAGVVYASEGGGPWRQGAMDRFLEPLGMSPAEYIESLSIGPVRSATVQIDRLFPQRYVTLNNGEIAREYAAFLLPDRLPEWWGLYDSGTEYPIQYLDLQYRAYVTRDGTLRRVEGLNTTSDGDAVLSIHTLDFDGTVAVELPDPAEVSLGEMVGAAPEPSLGLTQRAE